MIGAGAGSCMKGEIRGRRRRGFTTNGKDD